MSLRIDVGTIFSLHVRSRAYCVGIKIDSIHPSAHLELAHCQCQTEILSCTRLLHMGWALDRKYL
jgi:hypothetical protein